jgi:uncharacterized protein
MGDEAQQDSRRRTRLVIDTNIVVAALWRGRHARELIERCMDGEFVWVLTRPVLGEYRKVIEPFAGKRAWVQELFAWLQQAENVVQQEPQERVDVIDACPADNRFLEAALAGDVDLIVSNDHHLLDLGAFRQIQIVVPGWVLRHATQ